MVKCGLWKEAAFKFTLQVPSPQAALSPVCKMDLIVATSQGRGMNDISHV